MLPGKDIFLLFIGSFLLLCTNASNTKHMYALCPPDFFGIGTECYYISQKKENWLDAHFDCKDRKSRLAEPNRYEDRMIRKFLVNNDLSKESKWIGGNYNWAQRKWQWQDGKEFTYQSFSQTPGGVQELQYHCAILNPDLKYRWSASSCVDKHQYICQHRMPYVNEKHRSRIYARWNQTYPNEQATQVEVVINAAEMLKRGHRQSIPVNGRSTNTQRLSRHRNYLANEWLKKYKSQQIVLNRNAITNEINLINTPRRKVPQRPNRLAPRRRNPSIGRDDFIQFERNKNVYRPLITNKVDDFDREESITVAPTNSHRFYEQTTHRNRAEDPTSPPRKVKNELDPKERKRLEDTKRLLETGRFEHSYTRQRIATTTASTTTTTEPNEQIELERDRDLDYRRQQEEEEQERLRDEEIRRNEQRRKAEERRREEEEERRRMEERRQAEERQMEEERLQNEIDEEKLRLEHEEELRRSRLQQEEQRRAEERKRIHDENLREREERMRLRELELKEREEEERKLREDEERRQEENRQRLEDIERQQREEEERKRQEAEDKRIEEENKRRKNEELKEKMRQNQVDISNEDQTLDDLRLKEKLRREKNARMRERLSRLSPEEQLKFFELRRRNKKNSETQQK